MDGILERDAELEALASITARAAKGQGRLAVIEGPPGRGRSTVLSAAVQQAQLAGLDALEARARTTERDFPFGVARQLFERVVADLDDDARARAFAGAAHLAEPLFSSQPPTGALDDDTHFQVVHGLYWLVANLAEERPLVLAVDDVHLCDHRSASQLLYLAERIDGLRCALVITAPSGPLSDRTLTRLCSHPSARVLELEPLSVEAVARITADLYLPHAAPDVPAAVHRLSGGEPIYVHEILTALDLDAGDDVTAVERIGASAPRSVAAAVTRHLDDLGEDARSIARAAAVLGEDAPVSAVAEVTSLGADVVERTVVRLVQAGVLSSADPVTFASPLVAAALSSTIEPVEGRALHRRSGIALLRIGRPLAQVARHLQRARPAGDSAVVSVLWAAAADAQAARQPDEAVALLRRALAEPAPEEVRADLLIDLGTAEAVAGDPGAVLHLEEAVTLHRSRNRRAKALLEAGLTVHEAGRATEAAGILRRGIDQGPPDDELRLELQAAHLAAVQLVAPLRASAAHPARRALVERARPDTRAGRSLLAHAALEQALRLEDVATTRAVARELATYLATDRSAAEATTATAVAGTLLWLGEAPAAADLVERFLTAARRRSELRSVTALSCRRAFARWRVGDITGAIADTELLLGDGPEAWSQHVLAGRAVRGMALIERGELPAAASLLEQLDDTTASDDESALEPMVVAARAQLALVVGRPEEALQGFERAGELATDAELHNPVAVPWRVGSALALAHLGERERAVEVAAGEARRAETAGLRVVHGSALRVVGLATGGARGAEVLADAVDVLEGSSGRFMHAMAMVDLGSALLARGRIDAATDLLRAAVDAADRCGAVRLAERARGELALVGASAPRRARTGQELTPGERRVVELAVAGLTNRAIAEQLFVSVKAVEWHLRNAYAKLGVANRRELAASLEDGDRQTG